jgi:hypothetical protein
VQDWSAVQTFLILQQVFCSDQGFQDGGYQTENKFTPIKQKALAKVAVQL